METNSVNIFATGPSFGKLDLKQFESPFHVNFCIKQTAFADYGRTSLMFFEPVNGDSNAGKFFWTPSLPEERIV